MSTFTESVVEQAALAWLESVGWTVRNGTEIAPGEPGAERTDYGQVVLEQRLRDALARLNPALPAEALQGTFHDDRHPNLKADFILANESMSSSQLEGAWRSRRTAGAPWNAKPCPVQPSPTKLAA